MDEKVYRYLLALLILAMLAAHALLPSRVHIDWPAIALLALFILMTAWPELIKFLPFIKRLKLGEAELELQDSAQRLHREVEKAENSTPRMSSRRGGPMRREVQNLMYSDWMAQPSAESEEGILDLASRDKESAVVRLAIEIEKELASVYYPMGAGAGPAVTMRELVEALVSRHILSRPTADAIIDFRDVRNKVIHPAKAGKVPDSVLASTIDSGIRLLRLLRATSQAEGNPSPPSS